MSWKFMVMLDRGSRGDRDSLPCKFCDIMFKSCKELEEHMIKKHKGESVHPCSVCVKSFKSLPILSQHTSRQHRGHVFVCEGCGKTFKTDASLNRHKKLVCSKPPSLNGNLSLR